MTEKINRTKSCLIKSSKMNTSLARFIKSKIEKA